MKYTFFTLAAALLFAAPSFAANSYWDINGATAGAGGATPAGAWDAATANWTADSTGSSATAAWTPGGTAVFSAGTDATGAFAVTVTGTQNIGGITVEEGTLTLSGGTLASAAGGAIFTNNSAGALAIGSAITAGQPLQFTGTGNISQTGIISGSGTTITKNGNNTLTLGGANSTYTGSGGNVITVNAGEIIQLGESSAVAGAVSSTGALPSTAIANYVILNGGKFTSNRVGLGVTFLATNKGITLGASGGTLGVTDTTAGNLNIYGGVITGGGSLTYAGPGVLSLTATQTYTGTTTVTGGTLRLRSGTPQIPNTDLTVSGTGTFDPATFTQTVPTLNGNGKVVFSGAGTLIVGGAANSNFSGVISDGASHGKLTKNGAGTLTLSGVNTYQGTFTNTAGTTTVSSGGSLCGAICDVVVNGGIVNLNNTTQVIENLSGTGGQINLTSGLSLTSDPASSTAYAGIIAGAGGLTRKNANATARVLTLSGANTYDGNTFVTNGTISVQNNTALGSTVGYTEVNQTSGTIAAELLFTTAAGSVTTSEPLRISGVGGSDSGVIAVTAGATPTISGPVTLVGDSTITVSGTSSVAYNNANSFTSLANQSLTLQGGAGSSPLGIGTISGAIALGSGSLNKLQGGTWVLSGSNSYTGATNIGGGKLSVSNVGNTGSNSNLGTNGTINIGATTTAATLVYTGTGETSDKVINLAGTTGSAAIDQSGTGNLKFTSDLTATGNGVKTLTLQGSTAGTGEIAGKIVDSTGATSLAKSGTGTWVLSGTSVYSGTTTVSGGTLLVNGSTTGTGAVSVTTATLGGTGSVAGAVTAGTGGNVSPGTSVGAIGALAIGALTFNTGSSFVYDLNSDSATGDLLNANGALNLPASGATLSLADAGTTVLAGGTKLTLISYAGAWNGNIFDTFADDSTFTLGVNSFTIDYNDPNGNLSSNLNAGSFTNYVTLTAVPEANAFWLGGAICLVLGLTVGTRRLVGVRTVA